MKRVNEDDAIQRQERFDPLTGRTIKISSINGFSTFKKEPEHSEVCFMDLKTGTELNSFAHLNLSKIQKDCKVGIFPQVNKGDGQGGKKLLHHASFAKEPASQQDQAFKEFFDSWTNPVLGVSKERSLEEQLNVNFPRQRGFNIGTEALVFSKPDLENVEVIGQVDNKFIACLMTVSRRYKDAGSKVLVLIDQHAAHERIRLEHLEDEFLKDVDEAGGKVRSLSLSSPVRLSLTLQSNIPFKNMKDAFQRIGIQYAIVSELCQVDKNFIELKITTMPAIFVKKIGQDTKCILEHPTVKELLYCHLERHRENPVNSQVIPHSIHNVLCSYACHGAIKFGDPLSLAKCHSMVQALAKCKLPFQCAHGRPSVAPLTDMSLLVTATQITDNMKPLGLGKLKALGNKS